MRVLIAPDSFTGTLSAVEAADAIARGWRAVAPDDDLDLAPLSDGGTGFVDVLSARLGGELVAAVVRGPAGRPTPAGVLLVGQTAYVESAQACGLHLLALDERDPTRTTTYGVGELVRVALNSGARSIVVGLGGSGTNDGGRGMLDALGADAERLRGIDLVAATDVDNPLVGINGASAVFGPQKGATPDQVQRLDHELGAVGPGRGCRARRSARGGGGRRAGLRTAPPRCPPRRRCRRGDGPARSDRAWRSDRRRRPRRDRRRVVRQPVPARQGSRPGSRRGVWSARCPASWWRARWPSAAARRRRWA